MADAARALDKHTCPLQTPAVPSPIPHTAGGLVAGGCPNVFIGGFPAARKGDLTLCAGPPPHPDKIQEGSSSVEIGGAPAARKGDKNAIKGETGMQGEIQLGSPNVSIGG